jgi:SagB-type dehydrogenase family enzyme
VALQERHSCRDFADSPLARAPVATVLLAALGIFGTFPSPGFLLPHRPAPTAGGRSPLEGYLLVRAVEGVSPGTYHYAAHRHALEMLRGPLPRGTLTQLYRGQGWLERSSAVLVLTAVARRTLTRYPTVGQRFLALEAGHVAQNAVLMAAALGIGAVTVGASHEGELARWLGVDPEAEPPLYSVALGCPRSAPSERVRRPGS